MMIKGIIDYKSNQYKITFKLYYIFFTVTISMMLVFCPVSSSGSTSPIQVNVNKINSEPYTFSIAVDDFGTIYSLWQEAYDDDINNNNIYVAFSTNSGRSFSNKVQINDVNGSIPLDGNGKIEASGNGNIYIIWHDRRVKDNDIYLDYSTDGGKTFGKDIKVQNWEGRGSNPDIAVDSTNNIYAVWTEARKIDLNNFTIPEHTFTAKYSYVNSSFYMHKRIYLDAQQRTPDICIGSDGSINIVWRSSGGNQKIYFSRSIDGGITYKTQPISQEEAELNWPKIVSYKNNIFITWRSLLGSSIGIKFTSSTDNGQTWSKVKTLDEFGVEREMQPHFNSYPSMAVDNKGILYIAWADYSILKNGVKVIMSKDLGKSWSNDICISTDKYIDSDIKISIITDNENNVYLAWTEMEDEDKWDIYIAKLDTDEDSLFGFATTNVELLSLSIIITLVFIITSMIVSETSRYLVLKTISSPFYSKLRKDKVLHNELRNKILNYIILNPGNHFQSIKRAFMIGNGNLAYHLGVLERENFIISKKERRLRKFYPSEEKIIRKLQTQENSFIDDDIQELILSKIREYPGISQKDLGLQVGLSNSGINYQINIMASAGVIKVERDGKSTRSYLVDD